MTDPRFTDPRLSDPMIRRDEWTSGRDENVGGMWSWVVGVSLLLLIGFLIFAGWNSNSNTANSGSPPTTTASRTVTPPSTTGSGSSSPQPITPAPIEERHAVTGQLFHEIRVPAPQGAGTTANSGKKTSQTTASQIAIIAA